MKDGIETGLCQLETMRYLQLVAPASSQPSYEARDTDLGIKSFRRTGSNFTGCAFVSKPFIIEAPAVALKELDITDFAIVKRNAVT